MTTYNAQGYWSGDLDDERQDEYTPLLDVAEPPAIVERTPHPGYAVYIMLQQNRENPQRRPFVLAYWKGGEEYQLGVTQTCADKVRRRVTTWDDISVEGGILSAAGYVELP